MSQGDQQQYVQLLQGILDAPQNTGEILARHGELLDQCFLELMANVASEARNNGRDDIAGFLAGLGQQLGELLDISANIDHQSQSEDEYLQFFMRLLQRVMESQGNPQVVYPFLQHNLHYLNITFGQFLQRWTATTFSRITRDETLALTRAIGNFGNLMGQFPLGQRWQNLELSIVCYEIMLKVFSKEKQPEEWAGTQNNLSTAYLDRIKGERTDNIEAAIMACRLALEAITCRVFPELWAMTQHSLANAYMDRIKGERVDNIEAAIKAYSLALEVFTQNTFPEQWAGSKNSLATAYLARIRGDRADNIETAIKAYSLALKVRTRNTFPEEWAGTQNSLANAYMDRIKGERVDNIEVAITAYQLALEIFKHTVFPEKWAMIQNNLATAYMDRITGSRLENIEFAIKLTRRSLEIYTHESFPVKWATSQNTLANAYSIRIKGDRAENMEEALAYYKLALRVFSYENFPLEWASTLHNLAITYKNRIKGKRSDNIEEAIKAFQLVLKVETKEAFPMKWAMTQHNLANAYCVRIAGDLSENIEEAIKAYRRALEIRSIDAYPQDSAMTQNNLANAYKGRIKGERAENIERAITFYERIFEVYTSEAFPEQWAMAQHNLATVYSERIKGERARNIEEAIKGYRNALKIHTLEANPLKSLEANRNFGNLYFLEKRWTEAITTYALAIKAVEFSRSVTVSDQRRQEIISEAIEVFANITQSHIELNQIDQALIYAERSKARNLTELLASRELYPKGDIAPEIIEKLKQLRSKIPTLDRQLQVLESNRNDTNPLTQQAREQISAELKQARTQLDRVLETIQPIDPTFTLTQTVQPITFAEIQELLDEQTAIVEWYVTQEKTFAFLVTTHQAQPILHTIETQTIAEAVQKYLELYGETKRFTDATAKDQIEVMGNTLCEALQLNEILEQLQQFNLSKIILIPHRQLHFLPLHALPLADGSCLLDKFSAGVSYAPSCQLLQVLERQEKSDVEHFFAIKNPTEDLLFSELEVEAISDYFSETDILDRHNASESNFRNHPNLEKSSHLYFSCHGTFDFQSPLNSALLLNKTANDEDNRLTLAEIFELSLPNCSLVSLSACETGITDLNSLGDEYIGLPSGFIYAGASAVISSLWPVSDLATAILMIQTYYYLKHGLPNQQKQIVLPEPSPFGFSFQGLDGSLQTGQTPMATTRTITSSEQLPTPAQALNAAQNWMRTLTPEKGQKFIDRIMPTLDRMFAIKPEMTEEEKEDQEILKEAYLDNLAIITQPNCPFIHPYYWAAFTAVGI